jgi:O-antigen ligase
LSWSSRRNLWLFYPSQPVKILVIFSGVCAVSFLLGFVPLPFSTGASIAAQAGGLALYLISFGGFIITAHYLGGSRSLQWMTWIFIGLGGLYVFSTFFPLIYSFISTRIQYGSIGAMFWLWLMVLPVSQALFNKRLPMKIRLFLLFIAAATFYRSFIQLQGWTSGWLPGVIAVAVMLFIKSPRTGIIAALFIGGLVFADAQRGHEVLMAGDNEYSLMTRIEAWRIMGEIIKINPITGVGFSNYYFYTQFYPILGYYVPFNSHNNYVDILAQTGILGLGCFVWFAYAVGRLGLRLIPRVPEGFPKAYTYAALGGLAGMLAAAMLGDWVLPFVYNIGFNGFRASILGWVFLGGLVALERIYLHPESSDYPRSTLTIKT